MAQTDKTKEDLIEEIKLLQKRIAELERLDSQLGEVQDGRLLATVVRDSNDAIIVQDINGRITAWNRGATQMYGYSAKEAVGMDIHSLTPPGKVAEHKEFTRRLVAGEALASFETQRVTKDGRILDVWLTVTKLVLDPVDSIISTGRDISKPVGFAFIERNISERKRAEECFLDEQKKFRELLDNMSSGVAVYEAIDGGNDFIFKDINKAGERASRVTREEVVGKSVCQIFPGIKKLGLFEVFRRVWETGKSQYQPASLYHDERLSQWVENYVYKLPSGEIVTIYNDITERKNADDQIRQAAQEWRTTFDSIPDLISILDKDFRIIKVNKAFADIFGLEPKEILGKFCYGLVHRTKEPPSFCPFKKYQLTKEKTSSEFFDTFLNKYLEVTISPILEGKGSRAAVVHIVRDITQRKEIEEKDRKHLQELEIFYKSSVGREERIIELKKEIEMLKKELGA